MLQTERMHTARTVAMSLQQPVELIGMDSRTSGGASQPLYSGNGLQKVRSLDIGRPEQKIA